MTEPNVPTYWKPDIPGSDPKPPQTFEEWWVSDRVPPWPFAEHPEKELRTIAEAAWNAAQAALRAEMEQEKADLLASLYAPIEARFGKRITPGRVIEMLDDEKAVIVAREKALRERLDALRKRWRTRSMDVSMRSTEPLSDCVLADCADQLRAILEETK